MPSCPNCGKAVGPGDYICDFCGQVLYDQPPTSQPGYQEYHKQNLIEKFANLDFKTIFITVISLFAAVGILIIVVLTLLPDPSIKASPPPGWYEVSEDVKSSFEAVMREEGKQTEIDYIFKNNSDNNVIIIDHRDISGLDAFPDTDDVNEMQSYIENSAEDFEESIREMGDTEVASYEAKTLACGDVAVFAQLSEHTGSDTNSFIMVREKGTVFFINFVVLNLDTCSEEIEYLCQTISFE